jgi:hypothetical protein
MSRVKRYFIDKRILLSIIMLGNIYSLFAQNPGFHGRKFSASLGVNLNSIFISIEDPYLNDKRIRSVLPLKTNLGLEYSVSKKTNLHLMGSFYPMPNSQFHIKKETSNDIQSSLIVDSFKMKSNMFSLAAGFRRYSEFSHYGRFFSFGISGNYFNSIIYPTTYRKTINNGITTLNEIEKLPTGTEWTYNLAVYAGLGRSHVFKNYMKVDYGVNFWLFLGKNNYDVSEDYRKDIGGIVDHLINKRSREAHLIELFLNIGILK